MVGGLPRWFFWVIDSVSTPVSTCTASYVHRVFQNVLVKLSVTRDLHTERDREREREGGVVGGGERERERERENGRERRGERERE